MTIGQSLHLTRRRCSGRVRPLSSIVIRIQVIELHMRTLYSERLVCLEQSCEWRARSAPEFPTYRLAYFLGERQESLRALAVFGTSAKSDIFSEKNVPHLVRGYHGA